MRAGSGIRFVDSGMKKIYNMYIYTCIMYILILYVYIYMYMCGGDLSV